MADRTVYLAPASNDQAYEHLSETVIDGVPATEIPGREPRQERFHIWGTKEETAEKQGFDDGDILLFYTGDKQYTQAAVIHDQESDEAVARSLWGFDDTSATQDTEPWSRLLYLDPPIEVAIDSGRIADYADYGIDYVLGLQSLNDQGHEAIIDEFGSIHAFIADHAVNRSPADAYDRSPTLHRDENQSGVSDSTPDETEITPTATADHATRWEERCQRIEGVLDRSVNVALTGPTQTISVEQAYQIGRRWLAQHQEEVDSRILSASIDSDTTYEEFVERPFGTTETTDSVTTTDGPFKRACRLAEAAKTEAEHEEEPAPQFLLLVNAEPDASVANALGPLRHILDESTRRREPTIQLPHSGETLPVPQNLTILVVTETPAPSSIPRSIQRHFRVIANSPDIDLLCETYGYDSIEEAHPQEGEESIQSLTVAAVAAVNDYLATHTSGDAVIGQDLFIDYTGDGQSSAAPGQYDNDTLRDIWTLTVIPQLNARLATNEGTLRPILKEFAGGEVATYPANELEEFLEKVLSKFPRHAENAP